MRRSRSHLGKSPTPTMDILTTQGIDSEVIKTSGKLFYNHNVRQPKQYSFISHPSPYPYIPTLHTPKPTYNTLAN